MASQGTTWKLAMYGVLALSAWAESSRSEHIVERHSRLNLAEAESRDRPAQPLSFAT
jgi:hypothetical protein